MTISFLSKLSQETATFAIIYKKVCRYVRYKEYFNYYFKKVSNIFNILDGVSSDYIV
jgi:hypothetical protein